MTQLSLQAIRSRTTCADEDDRLVLAYGCLIAVPVRLRDAIHGQARGRWRLEASFGRCATAQCPPFVDLPEAVAWVAARLNRGAARAASAPSSLADRMASKG
jgi:hypothetical protein